MRTLRGKGQLQKVRLAKNAERPVFYKHLGKFLKTSQDHLGNKTQNDTLCALLLKYLSTNYWENCRLSEFQPQPDEVQIGTHSFGL